MFASVRLRLLLTACLIAAPVLAHAQISSDMMVPLDAGFGPMNVSAPAIPAAQIIKEFTAKESEFRDAMNNYTYTRTVKMDTLNSDGKVTGQYYEVTNISFDPTGRRMPVVTYAPPSTIGNGGLILTEQDFSDIVHRDPFVLTTEDAQQYNIAYVGRQRVDQVDTYVFNVWPKVIVKGHRYFQGRIWVDQKYLQIVVADGKNVPDDLRKGHENLFLPFITFYQQVDGKYWFPVWTHSDGVLHFTGGNGYMDQNVHLTSTITYSNYKQYHSSIKILFNGKMAPNSEPQKKPK